MTAHKTRTVFWPLTIILRGNYALFWLMAGSAYFLIRLGLLRACGLRLNAWTELFFAYFIIAGLTAPIPSISDAFDRIPSKLSEVFSDDSKQLSNWAEEEGYKVFDRSYRPMWFISVWVNVFGSLTLLVILRPFESPTKVAVMILSIQPVFFMCGYTTYFLTALGLAIRRLVRLPLSLSFLDRGHRAVVFLSGLVYFLALSGLIQYLGLFAAIRLGPTRHSTLMAPWLIGLSVTPIIIFGFGIYQIHVLQREIKLRNLESISAECKKAFQEVKTSPSKETVEKLAKLVEIQDKVEGASEWPMALGTVLTFILALAAAGNQIAVTIANLLK